MSKLANPECTTHGVEVVFTVDSTAKTRNAVRRLAKVLGKQRLSFEEQERILSGSLLAADETEDLFVWFHIDHARWAPLYQKKERLAFHLRYSAKPKSAPPASVVNAWRNGGTVDRLNEMVDELWQARGRSFMMGYFTCRLGLSSWTRSAPPLIAAPITIGDATLEVAGAEYAIKGDSGRSSVQRVRWSSGDAEGTFRVWLEYITELTTPFNPWQTERERCRTYATKLL